MVTAGQLLLMKELAGLHVPNPDAASGFQHQQLAVRRDCAAAGRAILLAERPGRQQSRLSGREIRDSNPRHVVLLLLVVFDPGVIGFEEILQVFWEAHDPTQGMRQGNDIGTQYRSAIYTLDDAQHAAAHRSRDAYASALAAAGYDAITTDRPYQKGKSYEEGHAILRKIAGKRLEPDLVELFITAWHKHRKGPSKAKMKATRVAEIEIIDSDRSPLVNKDFEPDIDDHLSQIIEIG